MRKVKTFKEYEDEKVEKALKEIQHIAKILPVSVKYGISHTMLRRYVNQRILGVPLCTVMGPDTVLSSEQEEILIRCLVELKQRGFAVCLERLIDSVTVILFRAWPLAPKKPGRKVKEKE